MQDKYKQVRLIEKFLADGAFILFLVGFDKLVLDDEV